MGADIIQVKYDELEAIATRFGRQAGIMIRMRGQGQRAAQSLRQGGWQGASSTAFFTEMDSRVFPALQRLISALEQAQKVTVQISQVFQAAEAEAAKPFKGTWNDATDNKSKPHGLTDVMLDQSQPPPDPYTISDVKQTYLSVFFSQYEDSDVMSNDILDRYLTNPRLMAFQKNLTSALVDRVRNNEAPLTPDGLYQLALQETGDPGTALIVAHNVTKALARGRSPIPWEKVFDDPLTYRFQGSEITFDPADFHPDAELTGSRGRPTVFYAMFAADALGTNDEGDWYHYYLNAAASYYAATGKLEFDNVGGITPFDYRKVVDGAIDGAMSQMDDGQATNTAAFAGWRYANALSYLEGAKYGADYGGTQDEVTRETNIHRQGVLFGLQLAGVQPEASWLWYVTKTGSAAGQFDTSVDLKADTYVVLDPWGHEVAHSDGNDSKGSGNNGGSR